MFPQARRGMTFMEVLIVIVILSILMAVALPQLGGFREGAALRSAARDLATAGLLARQFAITQQEPTFIRFDPESGRWNIDLVDQEAEAQRRFRDQRGRSGQERDRFLPDGVTIRRMQIDGQRELPLGQRQTIIFYPSGSSSGMAIQLGNRRDSLLVVEFDRATGRPEVYEGEPKTLSQKLRERGLDPVAFGLPDDRVGFEEVRDTGFRRIAGQTEEERVDAYRDVVERMLERSRVRDEINQAGSAAAFFRENAQWSR